MSETTETDGIIDQAAELAYEVIRRNHQLAKLEKDFVDSQIIVNRVEFPALRTYTQSTFWRQVALGVFRIADKKLTEIEKNE